MLNQELLHLLDDPPAGGNGTTPHTDNKEIVLISAEKKIPAPVSLSTVWGNPPKLTPEVIRGILRKGHKMMLSGPSKAGKTWLLMELALCVATGKPWLNFLCAKGNVLYINMELDEKSCFNRFDKVGKAMGVTKPPAIKVWNLRGFHGTLGELEDVIAQMVKTDNFSMVIIDPIYKLFQGSENDQEAVAEFCSGLDVVGNAEASVVYSHHHSKGLQGNKDSMDRASGSGVFARDADAIVDMIELFPPAGTTIDPDGKGVTGWQIEFTLREFPFRQPLPVLFEFPLHSVCTDGRLNDAKPMTPQRAAGIVTGQQRKGEKQARLEEFKTLLQEQIGNGNTAPHVECFTGPLGVTAKTIKNYAVELGFQVIKNQVHSVASLENGKMEK